MLTYIENTPPGPRAQADRSRIEGWGADLDHANRPGYPKERTPPRLDKPGWTLPDAQFATVEILHSNERKGLTPVFGTSQPPSGLSGAMRRLAFRFSENDLKHWLLLLVADRVNVGEGIVEDLARGHVPNVFGEMGLGAAWKHNRQAVVQKGLIIGAAVAVAIYLARRQSRR